MECDRGSSEVSIGRYTASGPMSSSGTVAEARLFDWPPKAASAWTSLRLFLAPYQTLLPHDFKEPLALLLYPLVQSSESVPTVASLPCT